MKNRDLLAKFLTEKKMSRKTRRACKQLESVISSLEALEDNEHDAAYEVVHKALTALKDKLCQEIYHDFLKCIFSEVEEAKQGVKAAEQAVQEAVRVSNAAYADDGFIWRWSI